MHEAPVVGVDLPSLLEVDDGITDKPTVVLLGQDPKRSSRERREEILVGTPYGLHQKGCRDQLPNTRLYFNFIKVLFEQGYRVYLTDVYKIWVSERQRPYRGIKLTPEDRGRFLETLRSELKIFRPTAVIAWGRVATKALEDLEGVMHFSLS